jgi:hypothetical protein
MRIKIGHQKRKLGGKKRRRELGIRIRNKLRQKDGIRKWQEEKEQKR